MAVKRVRRAAVLVAFAALLAVPAAQAAWGELEASSVSLGLGSQAEFVPLFFSVEQSFSGDATTPAHFELEAMKVRVEVDHATAARAGSVEPIFPDNTTHEDYQDAAIQGLENRGGYRFMLIPGQESRLEIQSPCATITKSEQDEITRVPRAAHPSVRPTISKDVSQALAWDDCGASKLTVLGSFSLALYEWDFSVTDASGSHEYTTGHFQHELTAGVPTDAVGRRSEAWVYVEDGRLDLRLVRDSPHRLYTNPGGRVETESGLLFQQAHITASETWLQEAQGDIYFQGHLNAVLDTGSENLTADVDGQLTGITVNHEALPLPASITNASPGGAPWLPPAESAWLFLLAPLGVLAWLQRRPIHLHDQEQRRGEFICNPPAKTRRHKRAAGRMLMARRHLELRRPRRALWQVRSSRTSDPSHDEALTIRAEALTQMARKSRRRRDALLKKALDSLESLQDKPMPAPVLARYFCVVGDLSWMSGDAVGAGNMILTGALYDKEYVRAFFQRLPYKDSLTLEPAASVSTVDVA